MAWTAYNGSYMQCSGSSFRRYTSYNGWDTDSMCQGAYGTYAKGASQRGRCTFADLSSFNLKRYKITSFRIYFTFSSAGGSKKKVLDLYLNSSNNSSWKLPDATTAGTAYGQQTYVNYTSAAAITLLENAIAAGNVYVTSYNGETATSGSSSYSSNYCKMTAGVFRIYCTEIPVLFHRYDATNATWVDPKDIWVYKTSDSQWHKVGRVLKCNLTQTTTVPPAALTANAGANGYACGADTQYNTSTFAAFNAFNKVTGNDYGWASASTTTDSQCLYLDLPTQAFLKSVTITNRGATNGVHGPIEMWINGRTNSTDSSNFGLSGFIYDLPGSTAHASTTIQIPEPYNQKLVQRIEFFFTNWDLKSNASNNYVCVAEISCEVVYPWGEDL